MKLKFWTVFCALSILIFSNCMANSSSKNNAVLEVVIFNVKPNISSKTVLATANHVTPLLQSLPGFISRTTAKSEKPGQWVDIVKWHSLKQAQSAAKEVIGKSKMKKFLSLMSSYKMYHFAIKNQTS